MNAESLTLPCRPAEELAADRILDAAFYCVLKNGFDKVRIEDIARAAGASRATVYRRFANREQIFGAMLARASEPHTRDAAAIIGGPGPFRERLQAVAEYCVASVSRKDWLRNLIRNGVAETSFRLLAACQDEVGDKAIRPFIAMGIRSGELRAGLDIDEIMAWFLRAMLAAGNQEGLLEAEVRRRVTTYIMPVLVADADAAPAARAAGAPLAVARLDAIEAKLAEIGRVVAELRGPGTWRPAR